MSELWKHLLKKKGLVSLVLVVGVGGGGAWLYARKPVEPVRYILASATKGTLITSVKGSGQVSGQSQLDIKPQVSGAILKVLVKPGQNVSSTTPLFEIDQKEALKTIRDASQSVRDAQISLASSQLSFNKLKQPPDTVALTQAEHAVSQAKRTLDDLRAGPDILDIQQAEIDLRNQQETTKLSSDGKTPNVIRDAYDDAVPLLKSITQSLQQALYDADAVLGIDNTGANDTYERQLSVIDSSKLIQANSLYPAAKASMLAFKEKTDRLKATNEDTATIDAALAQAQTAMDQMGPLLQFTHEALLNTVTSPTFSQSSLSALQSNIQSNRSTISTKVTSLVTQLQSITQARTTFTTAEFNVQKSQAALDKLKRGADQQDIAAAEDKLLEAERSLEKLKKGTEAIDLSLAQNSIQQRQSALAQAQQKLADAQQTLANYTVRAPFDGVIAKLIAQPSDQASAGTVLATLVTPTKLVQLSLNEVDATKVKVDQKATLTFDAIPDLEIAGRVYEIDPLGAVSQGVVNYAVKVAFETQDERIKSGMSASVSIITEVRTDVIIVPNAGLRKMGNTNTVQTLSSIKAEPATDTQVQGVLADAPPESRIVEVGITNDQSTEIISGLAEGDQIVVRTIDPATTAAARVQSTGTAGIRIPGLGGGAGGGGNFARPAGR